MDLHDLFRRHGEHHRADFCRLHIAAYIAHHRLGNPATMSERARGRVESSWARVRVRSRAQLGFASDQEDFALAVGKDMAWDWQGLQVLRPAMKQAGGEIAREKEPTCRIARCAAKLACGRKDDEEDVGRYVPFRYAWTAFR